MYIFVHYLVMTTEVSGRRTSKFSIRQKKLADIYKILYNKQAMKNDIRTAKGKIVACFTSNGNKDLYVNELIRVTGEYPNSISTALKKLFELGYVTQTTVSNKTYYALSKKGLVELGTSRDMPEGNTGDWVKLLNRKSSCSFNAAVSEANVTTLNKIYGVKIPTFWCNGVTYGVYYRKTELSRLAESISAKIKHSRAYAKSDAELCLKYCDRLVKQTNKLRKLNLRQFDGGDIEHLFQNFYKHYLNLMPFIVVPHSIERYFENQIKSSVSNPKDLEVLLSPVSHELDELESVMAIVSYYKGHGDDKKYYRLLQVHTNNYCWLNMWDIREMPLGMDYFDKSIRETAETVKEPLKELERLKKEETNQKSRLEDTLRKLKATRTLRDHVYLLQKYIYLRTYRKNAISRAHYNVKPLLEEIAHRLEIDGNLLLRLTYKEILGVLRDKNNRDYYVGIAKKRESGWAVLMLEGKTEVISGMRDVVEAIEKYSIIPVPLINQQDIITGRTAQQGSVTGTAKIIYNIDELSKIENGDILVTKMTTPDFVVAMRKCSGIVTDEGGVTCHAAIVSRELGVPCVVGTKTATTRIQDGYVVELNATRGFVRVIRKSIPSENTNKLFGKSVVAGDVVGTAVLINDDSDIYKIQQGTVIVASNLTPNALTSLFKTKGIILEEDSLTSHGVLYAKALKIPCVSGVLGALSSIKDGQPIELFAGSGVVKIAIKRGRP